MPDWDAVNGTKINKAVFLLLEKYHRSHGLIVLGWSKPPGNNYYSFCSLAACDDLGHPLHVAELYRGFNLTTYQDRIGIPAWSAGDQVEHPHWTKRELRSTEITEWYERNLGVSHLFNILDDRIDWWRRTYHVSESEPYLLMWNVMGLFASALGGVVQTYERSENCSGIPKSDKHSVEAPACPSPFESVHFCEKLAFCTNGKVLLPNGSRIDLWQKYLQGQRPGDIAGELINGTRGEKENGS